MPTAQSGEPEEIQPLPGLADALAKGGIFYGLAGEDRSTALRSMVRTLELPPDVDLEQLHQSLLAREALGSTGVGDGIAIPHTGMPLGPESAPAVALGFLERPVDFGAPDDQPVSVLFILLTPTVRAHLHLLSRLATALADPGFQAVIKRRGSIEEILEEARRVEVAHREADTRRAADSL